jgi:hypothetical protein
MREERERERREKRTTNVPAWTGLYRKCTLCCVLAVAGDAHGEERQDGHTVSLSLSFSLTLRFLTLSATSSRDGVRKRRVEDGRREGRNGGRGGGLVLDENIREAAMGSRSRTTSSSSHRTVIHLLTTINQHAAVRGRFFAHAGAIQ